MFDYMIDITAKEKEERQEGYIAQADKLALLIKVMASKSDEELQKCYFGGDEVYALHACLNECKRRGINFSNSLS